MTTTNRDLGPGFRALFCGSLVSNTGDGIRLAALPLLATALTDSPLLIAAVTAAQYLPWITVAPIGGVVVDRSDRRRVIVVTQIARGVVMAALALLVLTDAVAIWQLCLVAFVITAGEILVDPSIVAVVPSVVDDEHLETANGRIASAEIITNDFAGGPVGAVMFAWAPWFPFVSDACTYLGSAVPFSRLPSQASLAPMPADRESLRADSRAGFDFLRHHSVLGPLTVAQVVYYFGVSTTLSLLVFFVDDELQEPALTFGLVLAAGAIGAFCGSLAGSGVAERLGHRSTLAGAVALQGAALFAVASAVTGWQLALIWFFAGVPAGIQRPVSRSLQQRLTPNHLLGRVNISARTFTRGIIIVGSLAGGLVAAVFGVRWSFVMAGVCELVAAFMMWRALTDRD